MKTPVVIFIYKRAENFNAIINSLKTYRPTQLFIIADGPKTEAEKFRTDKTRQTLESMITWPCQLHKNYASTNLGLKARFHSGISWVFAHAERAIFIEDDCLPDPSFFLYCEELLEKYQSNPQVLTIAGNNFQPPLNAVKHSYYFSRYPHVWGWASWKRVWDHYDVDLKDWPKLRDSSWLKQVYPTRFFIRKFWTYIFDRLWRGEINTWDYQLTYLSLRLGGYNLIPQHNLVSNVGYGREATNLKHKNKTIAVPTLPLTFPLRHPSELRYHDRADRYIEELVYLHPLGKISLFLKSLLGRL